jgi:hypothetical protein
VLQLCTNVLFVTVFTGVDLSSVDVSGNEEWAVTREQINSTIQKLLAIDDDDGPRKVLLLNVQLIVDIFIVVAAAA